MARPVVLSCNCPPIFPRRSLAGGTALDEIGGGGGGRTIPCPQRASAFAALAAAPPAFEAQFLLAAEDDPAALADHAVARSFDAAVAAREIEAALAADDPDLAMSFLALARERDLPIDPALAERVER